MIYLDKNLITELSPEGVIAYVAIRMSMHTKDQTEGYFSPGNMFYALGIPFEEEHYIGAYLRSI